MKRFYGKAVCGGVAIGKVRLMQRKELQSEKIQIHDTKEEQVRLQQAISIAQKQLLALAEQTKAQLGESQAQIFEIHSMMLEDEDFMGCIDETITQQHCNAEYAVQHAAAMFADTFAAMDDAYMQARTADVKDISERLLRCLSHRQDTAVSEETPCILCADDLSPSETAGLSTEKVLGFATAHGSASSHTAILARSMNIPAIVGLGDAFLSALQDDQSILLDGDTGECIIAPDAQSIRAAEEKQNRIAKRIAALHTLRTLETITAEGKRIRLYANISNANDMQQAIENGAEGVGLYRSEFLYLQQNALPDEETQYHAYRHLLEQMPTNLVIIRTLDIGADKQTPSLPLPHEDNPALGVRGIRLCLARPQLFRTQLRALYRASVHGKLGIMFPMITETHELRQTLSICAQVQKELRQEGLPCGENIKHGIMIETPAAAIGSAKLAALVDFFSIGTNDLTQYTLACDRQNHQLEYLHSKPSSAVMQLIAETVKNAHANGIWAGICGEMAADSALTEALLQMGIDELSVSPKDILPLREHIRKLYATKRN